MLSNRHIFIVEDEPPLAFVLSSYFIREGAKTSVLHTGAGAVEKILEAKPDLVILDINLPGKDGLAVCRALRAESEVPIILESARVEELDRLFGLELGADDYICKPWSPREVVARAKAILRRTRQDDPGSNSSGLRLDKERWTAVFQSRKLDLTRREFQLLNVLWSQPGRVFSRAQLIELAFPEDSDVFDRTIDSHIKNIRSKLRAAGADDDIIRSIYGVGYVF
ncbi:response regulator [Hoeflea poritis]|uniref:Response regulator n=1 Tax=Hoeflea poritis TaxID=2993659 RepID=A0ABT4VMR2_9HYPH|nr:response regulator [Hoeflea poritis]MDA4845889.1 response regulator [Hoeflea poritis]